MHLHFIFFETGKAEVIESYLVEDKDQIIK